MYVQKERSDFFVSDGADFVLRVPYPLDRSGFGFRYHRARLFAAHGGRLRHFALRRADSSYQRGGGPFVARQFGVPVELIADPQINVRLANQLLSSIVDALQMAENTPARDRMSIMLACYNSGLGHVRDARRLARRDGRNPDSWDTVLDYLSLKALPEYYESELVRCGRFTGSGMTQAYVDDVLEYYHEYCKRAGR